MANFLFIDESGSDLKNSAFEVFAGVVIRDKDVWEVIKQVHSIEDSMFGCRYSMGDRELKGKKILKKKTYRLANQLPPFLKDERKILAFENLTKGTLSKRHLTALCQAKIEFVKLVLEMLLDYNCQVYASVISNKLQETNGEFLAQNYQYLFECFSSFLASLDKANNEIGIIVFDEVEKSHSHKLIHKIEQYVKKDTAGLRMSELIIPEPFFVQSDLSTGVQLADLIAYIISWSFVHEEIKTNRLELKGLNELVKKLASVKIKYFQ